MNERVQSSEFGLMRAMLVACCAVLFVAAAGHAHAALYKWTDERGVVHYSDTLPPEAVNRANYQLDRQGVAIHKTEQARPTVQRIPRTETEEQKLRDEQRERMLAERRDRALIESYSNEGEIDLAKSRALATIEGQAQSAQALVVQMTKRRGELKDKEATYAPRPVPGAIKREIENIDAEVARQNEFIAAKRKESATIAARYDADKERFRELRAAPAQSGAVVTSDDGRYATHRGGLQLTGAR
jgi:hypothetical protein